MNLLVGATGFVGGHVVEYLFQQGEISKAVFRKGSHLKILDSCGVMSLEADLMDHHSLHEAVEGCDTLYSMASPMPFGDAEFERVNSEGLRNLLEAAKEAGVKTVVHLSTLEVYGFRAGKVGPATVPRPADGYQKSKLESDEVLAEFGRQNPATKVAVIRAARAVGSRDTTFAGPLLGMIESASVVLPQSAEMSFSHPKDIAQAMYKVATGRAGGLYLLKSFDATGDDLARGLAASTGKEAALKRPGLFTKSTLPAYTQAQLKASLRVDEQPGWRDIGYSPLFGLKQTCDEIADWHRKEPWASESPA